MAITKQLRIQWPWHQLIHYASGDVTVLSYLLLDDKNNRLTRNFYQMHFPISMTLVAINHGATSSTATGSFR